MDTDTRSSGTRLFYQVKPSGRRKVLKMVPGTSIQTQTMVTSSVCVLSTSRTLSRASPNVASVPPPPPLSHGNSSAQVQPSSLLYSSLTNPTLPVKPAQSTTISLGTHVVQVPAPVQPSSKTPSRKMVLVSPTNKSVSPQINNVTAESNTTLVLNPSPAQPHVSLRPPTAPLSESSAIRTFTKVTATAAPKPTLNSLTRKLILHLPQRPNSPNKWVVEENGANSSSSSQAPLIPPGIAREIVEVMTKREQLNKNCVATQAPYKTGTQSECTVVMWNEKMFFRVEKEEPKTGAARLIDLCDEDLSKEGKAADTRGNDEDNVNSVGCCPAQTGFRAEEEAQPAAPEGHSSSTQHASSREGPTSRARNTQTSSSSPVPCPVADHKLKRMFGITSEVEIRLPRMVCLQAPPLDYTEPIEEDFLCDANPLHSQDCPQVEATSSRVGRTRKRTKCACCSPAALFRHRAHKRRSKPADRRETARKQLQLSTVLIAPKADQLNIAMTTQKLVKPLPAPTPNSFTSTLTTTLPAPLTTSETTTTIPISTPVTVQKTVQLLPAALTNPLITRPDVDCEELQIHREIHLLREALRLKEAALEKLKSHKNA